MENYDYIDWKKISEGIAIGKLSFYKRDTKEIRRIYVKDVEKEVMRFQKSKAESVAGTEGSV